MSTKYPVHKSRTKFIVQKFPPGSNFWALSSNQVPVLKQKGSHVKNTDITYMCWEFPEPEFSGYCLNLFQQKKITILQIISKNDYAKAYWEKGGHEEADEDS